MNVKILLCYGHYRRIGFYNENTEFTKQNKIVYISRPTKQCFRLYNDQGKKIIYNDINYYKQEKYIAETSGNIYKLDNFFFYFRHVVN